MKRRFISLLLIGCVLATMFVGCGSSGSTSTDTEQRTETLSKEQGTEFSTEQGTEQSTEEKDTTEKYHFTAHMMTIDGCEHPIDDLIYQYVTGYTKGERVRTEFSNFLASENSTEGKEALKKLYELWNAVFPDYRNGELVVDKLACSISYDDENYQLINNKDTYNSIENTTTAILYNVTLISATEGDKPFSANVIIVLRKGDAVNYPNYKWGEFVGMYSLDSADKYFPDYNIE